jgi:hypothetical protein
MASWKNPGRAIRVVIHEEEGPPRHYWRDQDGEGNSLWRKETARPGENPSSESMSTPELLKALEASLLERRRASRGRKLKLPFR